MASFEPDTGQLLKVGAAVVVVVLVLTTAFYGVGAGEHAVVFDQGSGQVSGPVGPGWHLKIPFIQEVVKYETRSTTWNAEASAASQDVQLVHAVVAVSYHPDPAWLPWLHSKWGPGYHTRVVTPVVLQAIKNATAQHDALDLVKNRETIRAAIYDAIAPALAVNHVNLDELNVVNLDFSPEFNDAIEQQVIAQRLAEKERNLLEAVRAQANQTIARAEGEAAANRILGQSIRENPEVVQWEMVRNWRPLAIGDTGVVLPLGNLPANP